MTTDNEISEAKPEEEDKPQVTIEELQKQLGTLQETSNKNEENWKGAQRDSSKKELTIQQLREQVSSNESQGDMIKALITMMATQKNQPTEEFTEEVKTRQPDLLKQYEQIVESSGKKRQLDSAANRIKTVQERTVALGVQGDEYDIIKAFAEAGQYDKADARLDKVSEVKQTKPPENKESEDSVDKKVAEKLKAELEKRGLLTQDTGAPSASAKTRSQKIQAYAEGKISRDEYEKAIS